MEREKIRTDQFDADRVEQIEAGAHDRLALSRSAALRDGPAANHTGPSRDVRVSVLFGKAERLLTRAQRGIGLVAMLAQPRFEKQREAQHPRMAGRARLRKAVLDAREPPLGVADHERHAARLQAASDTGVEAGR